MSEQSSGALRPVKRTISLDAETDQYLKELFPTGRGVGPFFTRLVTQHQLRRQLGGKYQDIASKEEWYTEANLDAVD